jgi:hypothetical protein
MIEPKLGVSYEVLSSFTNRLKAENDPGKLAVTEDAEDEFLAYWYLDDKEKKIQHRAVANLPFGFPPIGSFSASSGRIPKLGDPLFPIYEATQALIDTGIVVTTASGNWGQESVWGVSHRMFPSKLPH